MSEIIVYSRATFPNQLVSVGKLDQDIRVAIATPLLGVTMNGECLIEFALSLSSDEKTVLDGLMAAHLGVDTLVRFHASSTILSTAKIIAVTEPLWEVIGEVVTNPSFFIQDLAKSKGRLVGQYKTLPGNTGAVRVVESGVSPELVVGSFNLPDTAGAWSFVKLLMAVPVRLGDHVYRVEVQNAIGSVSLEIKAVSVSLLEFIPVPGV